MTRIGPAFAVIAAATIRDPRARAAQLARSTGATARPRGWISCRGTFTVIKGDQR